MLVQTTKNISLIAAIILGACNHVGPPVSHHLHILGAA